MKSHRKRFVVAQNLYSSSRHLPGFFGRVCSGPHLDSVSSIFTSLIPYADKILAASSSRFFKEMLSLDVYGLRFYGLEFSGSWSSVRFSQ